MRYMDAIWGRGCWSPNIASAIHYNCEKMQRLQIADDYLGKKFWGYGINRICDGKEWHKILDIQEIEKLPELNKHHQPYRFLAVLTFKIQEESLYVSTFILDSVSVGVESRMNGRYFLRNFENARTTTINNKLHVEFIFQNTLHPITFQLDDYYVPGHLVSERLAQYYIEGIKKEAQKWQVSTIPVEGKKEQADSKRIHETESAVRKLIAEVLVNSTEKTQYHELLTGEVKQNVRKRIDEHCAAHPGLNKETYQHIDQAMQFCDVDHLRKVITNERYWSFFEPFFSNKEKTDRYFEQFGALRHAVMHNREVTDLIAYEGSAAILWLSGVIKVASSSNEKATLSP